MIFATQIYDQGEETKPTGKIRQGKIRIRTVMRRGNSRPAGMAKTGAVERGPWRVLRKIHVGVAIAVAVCLQGETGSSLFADSTPASAARMLRGRICVGRLRGGGDTAHDPLAENAGMDPAMPRRNQRNSTVDSAGAGRTGGRVFPGEKRADGVAAKVSGVKTLTREARKVLGERLRESARLGDATEVRRLVTLGARVDAPTKNGTTALHLAAAEGHIGSLHPRPVHPVSCFRLAKRSSNSSISAALNRACDPRCRGHRDAGLPRSISRFTLRTKRHRAAIRTAPLPPATQPHAPPQPWSRVLPGGH